MEATNMPDELWADLMIQLDEAVSVDTCYHTFISDGRLLVEFCTDAVVVLREVRAEFGDCDVFDPPVDKSMHAALSKVVNFLRSKNKTKAMEEAMLTYYVLQVEADPRTFSGMTNQVKEAILLHIELVLRAVKVR